MQSPRPKLILIAFSLSKGFEVDTQSLRVQALAVHVHLRRLSSAEKAIRKSYQAIVITTPSLLRVQRLFAAFWWTNKECALSL